MTADAMTADAMTADAMTAATMTADAMTIVAEAAPDFECTDLEQVPLEQRAPALDASNHLPALLAYLMIGVALGMLFVTSEVVSWYRIQEMFRFHSVHMYGIIGSAVVVAAASLWVIRRLNIRTLHGEPIVPVNKLWGDSPLRGARYWLGGTIFGLGWGLIGACPGPMFALVGSGMGVMLAGIVAAMAGTWVYAIVQHRLPH